MSKVYKYSLDKSSKKFKCPNCQKKRFVKYVNNETKQYLEDKFGRCDRENECGYHISPSGNSKINTNNTHPNPPTIVFPNGKHDPCLRKYESPFHVFCKELNISQDHIEKWNVGTAGRYTAFGIFDQDGTFLNIKYTPYEKSGKRMRGKDDYPFYISPKGLPENHIYSRCFFGLHLYEASKVTIIVESEKSAVLASYFYPGYNWLATGGSNGIKNEHMGPLLGSNSKIIYFGDNDQAGQRNSVIRWLDAINKVSNRVEFLNVFFDQVGGYDIADYIVEAIRGKKHDNKITGDLEKDLGFKIPTSNLKEMTWLEMEKEDKEMRALEEAGEKKEYITKKGKNKKWALSLIMDKWGKDLYRSEINKMLLYKNEEVDDQLTNDMYWHCHESGCNITKDDLRAILGSSDIPSRHPIKDFIQKNALTTKGNISKIVKSLNSETYPRELAKTLFTKWYVGMIGNIFNSHVKSPLMLVLYGGQNNGKTWFFRNLLPMELINMDFFVDNKLDKDIEEIMSGKVLVLDDEYGGKSKRDSKILKDIISKNKFSFRCKYGKLPVTLSRIATLCGTTNEPDILVDTTGNRRVIPFEIIERDFDLYDSVCKTQLFLEAHKLYSEGFKYELTKEEIEQMNQHTNKFERETTEAGLIDKYFRPVPADECQSVSYKLATREGFEWLSTTEMQIFIKNESGLNRISNIIIGKELRKADYYQKRIKVKGKVGRYWACRKIGESPDMEQTPPF